MTKKLRPCSGGCGRRVRSHLPAPMCHPCRRERKLTRRTWKTCADCGNPVDSIARYQEPRCRPCARARRATCPPCSTCGGKMGDTWFYKWLKGKAHLPPVCFPCQKAAKR